MVSDFVKLIVGRETGRADVCENNISATTVSLRQQKGKRIASNGCKRARFGPRRPEFALTGKPRADMFDKCVEIADNELLHRRS